MIQRQESKLLKDLWVGKGNHNGNYRIFRFTNVKELLQNSWDLVEVVLREKYEDIPELILN